MARGHDFRLAIEKIIARRIFLIEAHVARRFLQWCDADARVFEQFGGDVGDAFASEMSAAQLRYGIIAVADQYAVIKCPSFFQCCAIACRVRSREQIRQRELRITEKLIEKGSPQTLGRAAVA